MGKRPTKRNATRRRAHFEMVSKDKVKITTYLFQKEFDLNALGRTGKIDLVTFKVSSQKSNFYAQLQTEWRGDIKDPLVLEIRAHELEEHKPQWGTIVAELSADRGYPSEETVEVTLVDTD